MLTELSCGAPGELARRGFYNATVVGGRPAMAMPFSHGLARLQPRRLPTLLGHCRTAVVGDDGTAAAVGGQPASMGPNGTPLPSPRVPSVDSPAG